jgi:hypothetical protein
MFKKKKQIEELRRKERLWARRTYVMTDLLRNTASPFLDMDPQDIIKHVDTILADIDSFNSRF